MNDIESIIAVIGALISTALFFLFLIFIHDGSMTTNQMGWFQTPFCLAMVLIFIGRGLRE